MGVAVSEDWPVMMEQREIYEKEGEDKWRKWEEKKKIGSHDSDTMLEMYSVPFHFIPKVYIHILQYVVT